MTKQTNKKTKNRTAQKVYKSDSFASLFFKLKIVQEVNGIQLKNLDLLICTVLLKMAYNGMSNE